MTVESRATRSIPRWPFVVAAAVVLLVAGGFLLSTALAAAGHERDLETAEQVVRQFDASYADADCDAFIAVTTAEMREEYAADYFESGGFDCDAWVADAEALTEDGEYLYTLDFMGATADGDEAEVETTESRATTLTEGNGDTDYTYELERIDGSWLITSYTER